MEFILDNWKDLSAIATGIGALLGIIVKYRKKK